MHVMKESAEALWLIAGVAAWLSTARLLLMRGTTHTTLGGGVYMEKHFHWASQTLLKNK